MYSIILTNGMTINVKATNVEWYERSNTIRLIDNGTVVARFNMDNVAGWVESSYKVEGDYRPTRLDASMLFQEEKTDIEKVLSNLDLSMSYVLESDHRSFENRETVNGWLFDKIIDWRKTIQPYIKKEV